MSKIDSIICKQKVENIKQKMYKIKPKYECKYCMTSKRSKCDFENHVYLCKYIHTNTLPSTYDAEENQKKILNYLVELQNKYNGLEKKINEIQWVANKHTRREMTDYLKVHVPGIPFQVWLDMCKVEETDLQELFSVNVTSAYEIIEKIVARHLKLKTGELPMYVFKQKPNMVYVYDRPSLESQVFEWKSMGTADLKKIMTTVLNKLHRKYSEWCSGFSEKSDHHHYRHPDLEDQCVGVMHKINNFQKTMNQKTDSLRKCIIEKIIQFT